MLCERCHTNPATAILTQTVGGRTVTEHLCAECAYLNGFTSLFNGFPFSQMLKNLARVNGTSGKQCPNCKTTLDEIVESGRIGCSECYRTFRQELAPTIQNIHGKAVHMGKHPKKNQREIPEHTVMEKLREELRGAVAAENFEAAAKLRDEIRKMEQGNDPARREQQNG